MELAIIGGIVGTGLVVAGGTACYIWFCGKWDGTQTTQDNADDTGSAICQLDRIRRNKFKLSPEQSESEQDEEEEEDQKKKVIKVKAKRNTEQIESEDEDEKLARTWTGGNKKY